MKMKHTTGKKCCDNKQIDLKVKDDQKITEGAKPAVIKAVSLSTSFSDFAITQPERGKHLIPSVFAPPPLINQLYILHCVYRI